MRGFTRLLQRLVTRMSRPQADRNRALADALRASPLFDGDYYLRHNPDVAATGTDPVVHYLTQGWKELRDPSAAFSTASYLLDHPDVARTGGNPLVHYLLHGERERRTCQPASGSGDDGTVTIAEQVRAIRESRLFDEAYYLAMNADLEPPPTDPIRHYCEQGWQEHRNPSEDFDSRFYRDAYADIRAHGVNPFYHYVVAGRAEHRRTLPDFTVAYEDDVRFGVGEPDVRMVAMYCSPRWQTLQTHRSVFAGLMPPRVPHDTIGCYEVTDPAVLHRQARLAKRHGLSGFCFELDTPASGDSPLATFLATAGIDFGFCVRVTPQAESRLASFATALAVASADTRCLRVGSRPLVVIMTPPGSPDADMFADHLRRALADRGGPEPFLVRQGDARRGPGASDAVLDLPIEPAPGKPGSFPSCAHDSVDVVPYGRLAADGVRRAREARAAACTVVPGVTLARALAARPEGRPLATTRFQLADYRRWIGAAIASARSSPDPQGRFVFIDSWNAWNDGLTLEPDRQSGFACLNETSRALLGLDSVAPMPKVSVVVPASDDESSLRRRLDDIRRQTYTNVELLLLDDCRADGSRRLLDEFAALHPDITRRIPDTTAAGSGFHRWARGIKAATGDLVWIAEPEDSCDDHFLETLVRCFDDEAVLLAHARTVFVDPHAAPLAHDPSRATADPGSAATPDASSVETAHRAVSGSLGIGNTIPKASGVVFKRPIDMPLLDDPAWLAMKALGDWVFYLHVARGGKIASTTGVTNHVRRHDAAAAARLLDAEGHVREISLAGRTVATLYDVPLSTIEQCYETHLRTYLGSGGRDEEAFRRWYDLPAVLRARSERMPTVMICTMGFYPGGAEILPLHLADAFRRRGLSVLVLSVGLHAREPGVRRMLRNDLPLEETSSVERMESLIREYGIECLHTHQWHIQKYPAQRPDVFAGLCGHVASLHGMIEHGNAATEDELRAADAGVTTWVYTADKNLDPFRTCGLFQPGSPRFTKIPNGLPPRDVVAIPRERLGLPVDAFVLCCVSRAIPEKGWAETIDAVGRARAISGRDIRLVLVGNGQVHDEYCRSGVPDFVCLVGFSENAVGHYAAADMGIMLSRFKSESFPLTVVDCLCAGKPFIASDVGDLRNMLATPDGMAGGLVELRDWTIPLDEAARLVAAFATDEARYARARAAVAEAAGRFHIDTVADQYIRLFVESVRNGRPA